MALALYTEKLTKTYSNQLKALIGVNLKVEKGDFFALLGSNGAGKTTAIGIICGLLKSTSGSVEINGLDQKAHVNKIKRMIGLMPQEFNFNPHEPNIEILINQAGYFGIARTEAKIQAEKLLKKMELWDRRFDVAQSLSGGMKRRLMLARALMHEPEILILDEPTAGVDVEIRQSMWLYLKQLNKEGVTIILTTHYLEEAEMLCRNIAIIDGGEIVEDTSMKKLLAQLDVETFVFDIKVGATLSELEQFAKQSPEIAYRVVDDHTLEVDLNKSQNLNQVFAQLNAGDIEVQSMRNKSNRLEALFVSLINNKKSDSKAKQQTVAVGAK